MTGGGDGGRGLSNFFGFEILGKSDFFGSMKDTEIFLGRGKKQTEGFLGLLKKDKGIVLGILKKAVVFLG